MKTKKFILKTFFILFLCFIGAIYFLQTILRFPSYTPAQYAESATSLNNPYIGWYQLSRYRLSDDAPFDLAALEALEYGPGLAMLEINLQNYQDTPISGTALGQLDALLSAWRSRGRQLILRFLYDWDGHALETEPADISLILRHMSQAAEVVNRYTDCVYLLQGIFIGAWGEMHTSNYMGEEDMLALANHLGDAIAPSIFLSVRTPEQWRVIARSQEPLPASRAFDGSLPARLGLFNDGMLGSDTDLGTYGNLEALDPAQYGGRLTRDKELNFQDALCSYVPNGGEAVTENPYNDFPEAMATLARTHVSYLNQGYDISVLDKWKGSLYTGAGPFDGMNGYDYISRHLGYRYVLRASSLLHAAPWEDTAWLSVSLENVGFSNSYRAFDVSLFLRNREEDVTYLLPVQTDTRLWNAGEITQLDIPLGIRTHNPGIYEVFLQIRDSVSGFDILLANEAAQDIDGISLGQLEISKFPSLQFFSEALVGK